MNDELLYSVKLELDERSAEDLKGKVNELAKSFDEAFKKAGGQQKAVNEFGELIDITEKATKSNNEQIKSLVDAQKALEEKRKEMRELNKTIKDSAEVTDEDATSKLKLQQDIKALSSEINKTQRETIALNSVNENSISTYNDLVAQNKALSIEMRNLPLDDTTGRLKELQSEYNANNEQLKAFDKELGNHQRNVGNYDSALGNVRQAFVALQGPLGGTASRVASVGGLFKTTTGFIKGSVVSLKAFRLALISTGIGALIVGLGVLIAAFMKLQPVIDFIERKMAQLGAVFSFVTDRIGAFLGWNEKSNVSLRESIENTERLTRAKQALADTEIEAIAITAKLQREISELRLATRDANATDEEKLELVEQAIKKQNELLEIELYFAEERARIARETAAQAVNDREANRKLAEAEAELERARERSFTQQRRLASERQSLIRSIQAAEDRAMKEELARLETLRKARADALRDYQDDIVELVDIEIESFESQRQFLLENFRQTERRKAEIQIQALRERGEFLKAIELEQQTEFGEFRIAAIRAGLTNEADIRREFAERQFEFDLAKEQAITFMQQQQMAIREGMYHNFMDTVSGLNSAFFGNNKALAIAVATLDTFQAAQKAAANTPGGPLAQALAASAALAQGFARIRQIQQTKIGGGTPSAPSTPEFQGIRTVDNIDSAANVRAPRSQTIISLKNEVVASAKSLAVLTRRGEDDLANDSITVQND
jgi:hypothetical protein